MSTHRSDRREQGISLIEVTVVMAVIGLLVSVGMPAMQEWLDRYRVRSAASDIATAFQLQRMRAVSQNQDFSIAFDTTTDTYSLYQGDPSTGVMLDTVARSLPFGVTFRGATDAVDTPSDEVIFHPDGSVNDSTATSDSIWVGNDGGDVFFVTMNRATGRIEVEHDS